MKKTSIATVAPALALLASVGWGSSAMFNKLLVGMGFSPLQNSMIRPLSGLIIMLPILMVVSPQKLRLRSWRDLRYFILSGALGLALCNTGYFLAMTYSTIALAAVMVYLGPALVMLMSTVIFKEKLTSRKVISLIMAFVGCLVASGIFLGVDGMNGKGFFFGFLGALGYAFYNIGTRFAVPHYESVTVSTYTILFYVIGMIPFVARSSALPLIQSHPQSLWIMLALGVFCTVMPYTLFSLAVSHMELSKATILGFGEPLTATLWGIFLFHEPLDLQTVLSMVLILSSIVIVNIGGTSEATETSETSSKTVSEVTGKSVKHIILLFVGIMVFATILLLC